MHSVFFVFILELARYVFLGWYQCFSLLITDADTNIFALLKLQLKGIPVCIIFLIPHKKK